METADDFSGSWNHQAVDVFYDHVPYWTGHKWGCQSYMFVTHSSEFSIALGSRDSDTLQSRSQM